MSAQASHKEIVKVEGRAVERLEYHGQGVVTLKQVDVVHGRTEGTASRNFNKNKARFVEGTDYFKILSNEIRCMGHSGNFPNGLILLTEPGYLMIAKSFTDDLAWKVQRQLVDNYFRRSVAPAPVPVATPTPMDFIKVMFQAMEGQQADQAAIKGELEAVKREVTELKETMGRKPVQMALPQTTLKPVAKKEKTVRCSMDTRDTDNPLYVKFMKLHKKRTLSWWKNRYKVPLAVESLGRAIFRSKKVSPLTLVVICTHLKMTQDELKEAAAYLGIEDRQGHFNCYMNP